MVYPQFSVFNDHRTSRTWCALRTTPTGPSHIWKERLSPSMPIPYAQALHTLLWSIVVKFCVELPLHPSQTYKKYVIVNDMICMSQKVVITNLAEDEEGSHFTYILRRIVSKNRL